MIRSTVQRAAKQWRVAASRSTHGAAASHSKRLSAMPVSRLVLRSHLPRASSSMLTAAMSTSSGSQGDKHEFQAETRQLLDIVTHSIYTDKEVFIRELISNASDALEKVRHLQATNQDIHSPELEPQIEVTTDEEKGTITIQDTGIGMTKDELVSNLGTIARSGSKAFLEELNEKSGSESGDALQGIIGKFGVGFYSAFMVADSVDVTTRSASSSEGPHVWRSDGSGSYEILPAADDAVARGSKIVINLSEASKDYAKASRIEQIIRQYSNFVSFPILLNGEAVNTVQALWTKPENEVSEEEYSEFYKFISNAFDEPQYRLLFRADAPLELKALLFVGSSHAEKFGYERMSPGVSLYSRKVLIERNSADILPDWLRFVRGVVDSEDLPLSLSREKMQDSRLIVKLKDVLTRRVIRFLEQKSAKEPEQFEKFFQEFGQFIKEGICTDFTHKDALAKLLRYESSGLDKEKHTTLDEYISRCPPDQNEIYYLCAPTREIAESSPYYEGFKKTGKEVLFVYHPIDDFVMSNVAEFNGRKVVSAEHAKLDVEDDDDSNTKKLSESEQTEFGAWLKMTLGENVVTDVKFTSRLSESPAIISDHESAAVRKMMAMVNDSQGENAAPLGKHTVEVNPKHPLIVDLNSLRSTDSDLATKVAKQVYTNATVAAGLVDDGRSLLTGLNDLLGELLDRSLNDKRDQ